MPSSRNRPPRGDNGPGGKGGVEYISAYLDIDFSIQPELYRVGAGEQGVLAAEPFKSEYVQMWRFKTPAIAEESSFLIYQRFLSYVYDYETCFRRLTEEPGYACPAFVGADMGRKYLQMGWTRARRYANHRGGRKWKDGAELPRILPGEDARCDEFAESARIFKIKYDQAMANETYRQAVESWNTRFGKSPLTINTE